MPELASPTTQAIGEHMEAEHPGSWAYALAVVKDDMGPFADDTIAKARAEVSKELCRKYDDIVEGSVKTYCTYDPARHCYEVMATGVRL
jgi:hypothetical protein